jgi:hypothetical protein
MRSLKRIRGAIGMGLTWALGWAVGGILIGVASIVLPFLPWDAFFEVFDAPLPALAIPGFFAGVFFSTVLGIAGHNRRFNELSLPRFAAWGGVGGLMLSAFPFALEAAGLASREGSHVGTWQIIATITGPFVLLSAASASVTLILARIAERRRLREAIEDATDVPLTRGAPSSLAGGSGSLLHPATSHLSDSRPASPQRMEDTDRQQT